MAWNENDHEHAEYNCETCMDRWIWSQLDA